jgi:hypothetical protein
VIEIRVITMTGGEPSLLGIATVHTEEQAIGVEAGMAEQGLTTERVDPGEGGQ